jgi:hypothetical protein
MLYVITWLILHGTKNFYSTAVKKDEFVKVYDATVLSREFHVDDSVMTNLRLVCNVEKNENSVTVPYANIVDSSIVTALL